MLDIKWIRDNPDKLDAALARRGAAPLADQLLKLDEERRAHLTRLQTLQGRRNEASKAIGKAKGTGDEAGAEELLREIGEIKEAIQDGEETERRIDKSLEDALARIPNIPLDDVPEGVDEADNVEIRRHGEAPSFGFAPKEHYELGEGLGLMDFEQAAKISGSRFTILKGQLARLERALWLEGDMDEPGYAGRPWTVWTANAAHTTQAADTPLRWLVVRP